MRLLAAIALILLNIACAQCKLATPQFNNLPALSSLRPQLQNILSQLDTIIPNIHELLNDEKFQQLQQQFLGTVLNGLGNHWSTATLAASLQQLFTQFVPQVSQMRVDWWGLAEQAGQLVVDNLPTILSVGSWLIGKRDATDARFNLDAAFSFIPNIHELLNDEKFQQLQQQFLGTVLNGLGNHWSTATLAASLQQLFTQFVPQVSQMRVDWWGLAEQAGQLVVENLPTILSVGSWLIGKRDARINYQQLLSELSGDKLAQILQVILNSDKATLFSQLRKVLQQLFASNLGHLNFDEMAAQLINHVNTHFPSLTQLISSALSG